MNLEDTVGEGETWVLSVEANKTLFCTGLTPDECLKDEARGKKLVGLLASVHGRQRIHIVGGAWFVPLVCFVVLQCLLQVSQGGAGGSHGIVDCHFLKPSRSS